MQQKIAHVEKPVTEDNGMIVTSNELHDVDPQCFARQLRALGQALEKFSFAAFDLELRSGTYLVTGQAVPMQDVKISFARFVRELLRGSPVRTTANSSDTQVDLRFSPEDVERIDERGRVKRQDSSKMPDPYSISQILRGAGSYLDQRTATQLVGISLKGKWVTVCYQTAEGRMEQAKQDLEYFYNYWVKMYLRRSNRPKAAAPSDPTVRVTWRGIHRAPELFNVSS